MKQTFLLFIAMIAAVYGSAQNVGIGTTAPDASSKLEISSGNSGILIPRLTAVQRMGIINPANGLLVFDTDSAAFAYRTGSAWFFITGSTNKANNWSTTGNAGTNANSFIGTTDLQPLRFRVNDVPAGWVDSLAFNTGLGFRSLDFNTGGYNTAIGFKSLSSGSSGLGNTASGAFSLYNNTNGGANTSNGAFALNSNTTGSNNTAAGANALASNTIGNSNTANGYEALQLNTTGEKNTANGAFSMVSNTTGSANAANGYFSLNKNTSGRANTANGNFSMNKNTTGSANTADGDSSLANHTDGNYNSAIGTYALQAVISGDGNTALGYNALGTGNFTSRYNTAIGVNAGANASNGTNNVFVGFGASMLGGLENVVAIGQGTLVPTSNTVRLGNSATIRYQAFTDWTNISDGRFKNNVKENVPGLAFISKLRPVTYNLAATALDHFFHLNYKDSTDKTSEELKAKGLKEKEQIIYTGFIAQEVGAAAKSIGFDFSGVDAPKNDNDTYGLRYAQFVVPLVKAVQEQQQEIELLKKEIQILKDKLK